MIKDQAGDLFGICARDHGIASLFTDMSILSVFATILAKSTENA
ncbi:hypothetical protein [Rosenbergiella epipactidis]|nr:hypothetical protein [Rosenbergiella epipactidis]